VNVRVEDVSLRTADGQLLAADLYHPTDAPVGGVVVVHGFSAHRRLDEITEQASALTDAGFVVLAYDGRGHGMSGGECTLGRMEVHDVESAVTHLRGRTDRVVTVGASMGALAVLSHATTDHALAGIVLVSIPSGWRSVLTARGFAAAVFTRTPAGRAYMYRATGTRVSRRWASPGVPTAQVKRVGVPVALVHGRQDAMIRSVAAVQVYGAAAEPRRIEIVDAMGHAFCSPAVDAVTRAVEWAFQQPVSPKPSAPGPPTPPR
jgi:pimeloyl-ACP methyl ester carboxylesterase